MKLNYAASILLLKSGFCLLIFCELVPSCVAVWSEHGKLMYEKVFITQPGMDTGSLQLPFYYFTWLQKL